MLDRVLTVVGVALALVVIEVLRFRAVMFRQRKTEQGRIRITYRYETPRIEGCPAHIAGEDVAGRETFSACGRLS